MPPKGWKKAEQHNKTKNVSKTEFRAQLEDHKEDPIVRSLAKIGRKLMMDYDDRYLEVNSFLKRRLNQLDRRKVRKAKTAVGV